MSFAIFNALASFESEINKIPAKKLDILVIIYLNNIYIYTKNPKQVHIDTVWQTLNILKKNGLYTNVEKRCFYKNEIFFEATLY